MHTYIHKYYIDLSDTQTSINSLQFSVCSFFHFDPLAFLLFTMILPRTIILEGPISYQILFYSILLLFLLKNWFSSVSFGDFSRKTEGKKIEMESWKVLRILKRLYQI